MQIGWAEKHLQLNQFQEMEAILREREKKKPGDIVFHLEYKSHFRLVSSDPNYPRRGPHRGNYGVEDKDFPAHPK